MRSNIIFDLVLDSFEDILPRNCREIGTVEDSVYYGDVLCADV